MKLELGEYIAYNSDLKMRITEIWYETVEYYMVKAVLLNNNYGFMIEFKDYKLNKNLISHWEKV